MLLLAQIFLFRNVSHHQPKLMEHTHRHPQRLVKEITIPPAATAWPKYTERVKRGMIVTKGVATGYGLVTDDGERAQRKILPRANTCPDLHKMYTHTQDRHTERFAFPDRR